MIDLGTAARLAEERFASVMATRSLTVTAVAPESVLLVSLPAEWLDRLVGVLVDNACRHARTAVRVEARAIEEGRAEFSVSDDGAGIPEAELPLLFHRFHRGTSTGEGAGLGLAIANSIVRATQGRWRVTNLAGGGARFAVVWPLGRGASAGAAELPATTPGSPCCALSGGVGGSGLTPAQTREPTACPGNRPGPGARARDR